MNSHGKFLPLALAALALVVTGCPHNEYVVQLKPRGDRIERSLVFYRQDGVSKDGLPNYQDFSEAEIGLIAVQYPALSVTKVNDSYAAHGIFTNQLPSDVGGAGTYTNISTSMGAAGFYVENFRGNDDLLGITEKRLKAADQMTDLLIGWSEMELGQEPGYAKLRQFLQEDFRRDLKNAGLYWWAGQFVGGYDTNAGEEFAARFGQYLYEHGYVSLSEIPRLVTAMNHNDPEAAKDISAMLRRLVARKMGVPDAQPVPTALAFLDGDTAMDDSFQKYLAGTELYHARLKQWDTDKKTNPALDRPKPEEVFDEIGTNLLDIAIFDTPDHLVVQLTLPSAPLHGNGKWDATLKQEVWDNDLPHRGKATQLPLTCFAAWAQANESFQREHIGKVALLGDDLVQYCLWRAGQNAERGREWDAFLTALQPGTDLTNQVHEFRFASEKAAGVTNTPGPSDYPRTLLEGVLK